MKTRVLIVDSDQKLMEEVKAALQQEGSSVDYATTGSEALKSIAASLPSLALLEIELTDISGIEVMRRLKSDFQTAEIPVVFISRRSSEMDKIVAFELGATDYLVKPFNTRELVLRVKAVLRRVRLPEKENFLTVGPIRIDALRFRTTVNNSEIHLTQKEFQLLVALARVQGRVLSRKEILNEVWSQDAEVLDRTVDAHIKALRGKLRAASVLIETVNRIGYCLRTEPRKSVLCSKKKTYSMVELGFSYQQTYERPARVERA